MITTIGYWNAQIENDKRNFKNENGNKMLEFYMKNNLAIGNIFTSVKQNTYSFEAEKETNYFTNTRETGCRILYIKRF